MYMRESEQFLYTPKGNINPKCRITLIGAIDREKSYEKHCAEGTQLVDGRYITTGVVNGVEKNIMICLQYKYVWRLSETPEQWTRNTVKKLSKHFSNYMIIPVLITRCKVSVKNRPMGQKSSKFGEGPFVLIAGDCAQQYFSPNLLQYYEGSHS